ncbi:hypothetical protein GX50_01085 [[Emmonsia] crescens]|uniref:RRM domain-containing protein n=1 Tax=[Emmonsia] crescens TaxID=73230 RepID=A0A2B7ZS99_9EURO|nr:hypothetical protein GX50_01085 [Emmonsia crescens]
MLKPFCIRDLLNPAAEGEIEQVDRRPQDEQGSSEPFLGSPFEDELMIPYKQLDMGEDGKFCPHSTYYMHPSPSMETDGRTAKNDSDRVISNKLRSDHNDRSSDARRNTVTDGAVTATPNVHRHGIVRVSAEEYDETIAAHPQAKLSYMDDDDGDTITVGSALELAERLSEPAPSAFFYPSTISVNHREHEGPMHIFDVNRSKSVLDIWRSFEIRTSMGYRPLGTSGSTHHDATAPEVAAGDNSSQAKPIFEKSNDDPRDRWFQPRNPPQVPLSTWRQSENVSIDLVSSVGGDQSSELGASGNIEPVQDAGSRLRHAKSITSDAHIFIPSAPPPAINPWTSLSTCPSGFESNGLTQREPESRESPIQENQPLLASFEAELSKIMEDKLVVDSSTIETQEQNTTETTSPQSRTSQPKSEPSCQPMPKPAEMLAQTMQTLLGGIRHLTSELRSKLPEVERRLSNAHEHIPSTVETTLFNTISAIGSHVQNLANAMQATATSSRATADRSREADLLATDQIVNGLRTLAGDIGEMGRTLFAAFDAPSSHVGSPQELPSGELPLENVDNLDQLNPEPSTSQPNVSRDYSTTNLESLPEVSGSLVAPEIERQTATPQDTSSADSNRNTILFMGNLHDAVTEQDVEAAFANKGFLAKVNLPNDSATGKHAGFGYVEFPCFFAASGALQALNGDLLHDQVINLEFSHGADTVTDSSAQQPPIQAVQASPNPPTETNKPRHESRPLPHLTRAQRASVYGHMQTPPLDDVTSPSTKPTSIRRAKSLGTLRRSPRHKIRAMNIGERPEDQSKPNVEADSSLYHTSTHSERRRLTSLHSAATADNTLADQVDVEPEFSARYPSLVPDSYDRNNRWSHPPPRQDQDVPRTLSPESQMARFPTVSQLEARTSKVQQPQPIDHWRPRRAPVAVDGSTLHETPASEVPARNLRDLYPARPPVEGRGIPGSWPPELYNAQLPGPYTPSSTRLSELRRSNTTIASDPAARLSRPFVPFNERHQRNGNSSLRRSATERQHRRPLGGVTFDKCPYALEDRPATYNSHMRPGPSTDALSNIPGSFPAEAPPVVPPKPIHQSAERQPEMQEHHRPTNDNRLSYDIDRCIAHLGLLGYGYDSSLPSHNLHIYAEASNGILEDAIEMIEEERKVYEQQVVPQ